MRLTAVRPYGLPLQSIYIRYEHTQTIKRGPILIQMILNVEMLMHSSPSPWPPTKEKVAGSRQMNYVHLGNGYRNVGNETFLSAYFWREFLLLLLLRGEVRACVQQSSSRIGYLATSWCVPLCKYVAPGCCRLASAIYVGVDCFHVLSLLVEPAWANKPKVTYKTCSHS
jgi:hypothetical protein